MAKSEKRYVITKINSRNGSRYESFPLTLAEAIEYYSYTLECGACYSHERGNKKINKNPTTIKSLISNLDKASSNSASNGCGFYYSAVEFVEEAVVA